MGGGTSAHYCSAIRGAEGNADRVWGATEPSLIPSHNTSSTPSAQAQLYAPRPVAMTPLSSLGHPTPTGSLKRKRLSGEHGARPMGWEDVQGLVDADQRPMVWTKSNTLLTAHPTQPYILGRIPLLAPSTSTPAPTVQFTLPTPDRLSLSPSSFLPASTLLLSPSDTHLFAYFPSSRTGERSGIEGDPTANLQSAAESGVAVIWERSSERPSERSAEVDSWSIATFWTLQPADAVVGGRWIGPDREYYTLPSRRSSSGFRVLRPPSAGPESAPSMSHLLLILSSNTLQLCSRPVGNPNGRIALLRAPLGAPYERYDGSDDLLSKANPRSARVVRTSVGLVPGEQSLLIATQLAVVPRPPQMEGISMALLDPAFGESGGPGVGPGPAKEREVDLGGVGEAWAEEVQLQEVRLHLMSPRWTITCTPLAPITHDQPRSALLTSLEFVPVPLSAPATSSGITANGTHGANGTNGIATAHQGQESQENKEGEQEEEMFTPPPEKALPDGDAAESGDAGQGEGGVQGEGRECLGLLCGFVDYKYETAPPASTLQLWMFQRSPVELCSAFVDLVDDPGKLPNEEDMTEWAPVLAAHRTFPDHILNLLADARGARTGKLLVGLVSTAPESRLGHKSDLRGRRGELRLLHTLTLADDLSSRPTPLAYKRDMPLSLSCACSPNRLFLTLTTPPNTPPRTLFAPYPSRPAATPWPTNPALEQPAGPLVQAFLNVADVADVARALWAGGASKDAVVAQFRTCWDVLDEVRGTSEMSDLVGTPVHATNGAEKDKDKDGAAAAASVSPEATKKSPSKTPAKSPEMGTGPGTVGSTGTVGSGPGPGSGTAVPPRAVELDCSPWTTRFVESLVGIYRACPDPEVASAWEICYDITKLVACERAFLVSRQKREEKAADGGRTAVVVFETKNTWNLIAWADWFLDLCKRIVADAIVQRAWDLWDEQGAPDSPPGLKSERTPPASALLLVHPMSLSLIVFTLKYVREFIEWMSKIAATTEQAYIVQCTLQDTVDRSFLDLHALEEVLGGVQGLTKAYWTKHADSLLDFREAFIAVSVPKPLCSVSLEIARLLTGHTALANKIALLISPTDLLQTMLIHSSENANDGEAKKDIISRLTLRPGAVLRTCLRCGGKTEANAPGKRLPSISWLFYEEVFTKKCLCGGSWVRGNVKA
ncbi:hypothetical protein CALCODRAFT_333788 [Calocera cornea HHB12733]|uniref:Mediator complex subunit 16 C-terminal domain-containing protein n=1 Tax=Calocera cornea HHB12733 TaxID=1353952 RepID=A0A165F1X7_9BASI|nr:hypothetical protein CALCODRAFT_333788 [Calocera cornea HHB12733]